MCLESLKRVRFRSAIECGQKQYFSYAWTDDERDREIFVCISPVPFSRLVEFSKHSKSALEYLLKSYLQKNYASSVEATNPYTVSRSFYKLCQEVANVSHELFAGALNVSGELSSYCSHDVVAMS